MILKINLQKVRGPYSELPAPTPKGQLTVNQILGRAIGGDISRLMQFYRKGNFSISEREDDGIKNLNLAMTGAFDSNELVKWLFKIQNPFESKTVKGFIDYKLNIAFQNNILSVLGSSDLVRLGIDAPHVYTKVSGEKATYFQNIGLIRKVIMVAVIGR